MTKTTITSRKKILVVLDEEVDRIRQFRSRLKSKEVGNGPIGEAGEDLEHGFRLSYTGSPFPGRAGGHAFQPKDIFGVKAVLGGPGNRRSYRILDPLRDIRSQGVKDPLGVTTVCDQSAISKCRHVLGNFRLIGGERMGQFANTKLPFPGQKRQAAQTDGI